MSELFGYIITAVVAVTSSYHIWLYYSSVIDRIIFIK
jgi:hypothetical protein